MDCDDESSGALLPRRSKGNSSRKSKVNDNNTSVTHASLQQVEVDGNGAANERCSQRMSSKFTAEQSHSRDFDVPVNVVDNAKEKCSGGKFMADLTEVTDHSQGTRVVTSDEDSFACSILLFEQGSTVPSVKSEPVDILEPGSTTLEAKAEPSVYFVAEQVTGVQYSSTNPGTRKVGLAVEGSSRILPDPRKATDKERQSFHCLPFLYPWRQSIKKESEPSSRADLVVSIPQAESAQEAKHSLSNVEKGDDLVLIVPPTEDVSKKEGSASNLGVCGTNQQNKGISKALTTSTVNESFLENKEKKSISVGNIEHIHGDGKDSIAAGSNLDTQLKDGLGFINKDAHDTETISEVQSAPIESRSALAKNNPVLLLQKGDALLPQSPPISPHDKTISTDVTISHIATVIEVESNDPQPSDAVNVTSELMSVASAQLQAPTFITEWDILKSIVYGGLTVSLTSLGVVSSAAGGEAKTLTVIAVGLANLVAGLFAIFSNILDLGRYHQDQFIDTVGHRFWFNGSVAILSYLIVGSLAPITYGFSFEKSDNRNYKFLAASAVSLVSIILLALGKARVTKRSYIRTVIMFIVTGLWASIAGYFAGEYIKKLLEKWGLITDSENRQLTQKLFYD